MGGREPSGSGRVLRDGGGHGAPLLASAVGGGQGGFQWNGGEQLAGRQWEGAGPAWQRRSQRDRPGRQVCAAMPGLGGHSQDLHSVLGERESQGALESRVIRFGLVNCHPGSLIFESDLIEVHVTGWPPAFPQFGVPLPWNRHIAVLSLPRAG